MDLTNLQAGEIAALAALATLVSAIVGASAALVSALIGAWNARHLARQAALRQYREAQIGPFMKVVNRSFDVMAGLMLALEKKVMNQLRERLKEFGTEGGLMKTVAVIPPMLTDEVLNRAAKQFARSWNACGEEVNRLASTKALALDGRVDLETLTTNFDQLFHDAIDMQFAAQDFICMTKTGRKALRPIWKIKDKISALQEKIKEAEQREERRKAKSNPRS
jgi:hypothetical protein